MPQICGTNVYSAGSPNTSPGASVATYKMNAKRKTPAPITRSGCALMRSRSAAPRVVVVLVMAGDYTAHCTKQRRASQHAFHCQLQTENLVLIQRPSIHIQRILKLAMRHHRITNDAECARICHAPLRVFAQVHDGVFQRLPALDDLLIRIQRVLDEALAHLRTRPFDASAS